MPNHLKLDSHYTERNARGMYVGAIASTVPLTRGLVVEFAAPFLPIGGGLAVMPYIEGGADAVRIDFTRWQPVRYGRGATAVLPFTFDQALAEQVARAFDADPDISWNATPAAIKAWLTANGVPL